MSGFFPGFLYCLLYVRLFSGFLYCLLYVRLFPRLFVLPVIYLTFFRLSIFSINFLLIMVLHQILLRLSHAFLSACYLRMYYKDMQ